MAHIEMIALTNYIQNNNPIVSNALGLKLIEFLNFHLHRINNNNSFVDKYDEETINESFHLFKARKKHIKV